MSEVIAILCSDIHLSEKPPIARADEHDWFATMAGYLSQVRDLSTEYNASVICGGDVFDKYRSSPQLINFAINHLPKMYSVAGQHDLPLHRLEDIGKSAFDTLKLCGNIIYLSEGNYFSDKIRLHGFSWGEDIISPGEHPTKKVNLLIAHKYVWYGEAKYPLAGQHQMAETCGGIFNGYDVALLGDNHKSWKAKIGDCLVYNPGSFMRRRSDEVDHRPQVGLLKDDCTIDIHYLDVSKDILTVSERTHVKETSEFQMAEFLDGLKGLGEAGLDFVGAVKAWMESNEVKKSVRQILTAAMKGK